MYHVEDNLLGITFFVKVPRWVVYRLRAIRSSSSNLRRGMTHGLGNLIFEMLA
jgi:hypothetical protein